MKNAFRTIVVAVLINLLWLANSRNARAQDPFPLPTPSPFASGSLISSSEVNNRFSSLVNAVNTLNKKALLLVPIPIYTSVAVTIPTGATKVLVEAVGGGGAGGSSASCPNSTLCPGGNGGPGGYFKGLVQLAQGGALGITNVGSPGASASTSCTTPSSNTGGPTTLNFSDSGGSTYLSINVLGGQTASNATTSCNGVDGKSGVATYTPPTSTQISALSISAPFPTVDSGSTSPSVQRAYGQGGHGAGSTIRPSMPENGTAGLVVLTFYP